MNKIKKLFLFYGAVFFLSLSSLNAQNSNYSSDEIIGKWILKSASYNGRDVSISSLDDRMFFEFALDGKVTFTFANGKVEKGDFLVRENKLIDPNIPEYLDADIVFLSKEDLILSLKEDKDQVLMTFKPAD